MNKELISFAETAALSAGKIILGSTNNIKVDFKGKTDLITNIDLESERSIIDKIIKSHPSHNILSEEHGLINNNSDYLWVIDPLDGTTNFVHGYPSYGVSIGLVYKNNPEIGVVLELPSKNLYSAQKGCGTFKNGKKINVSKVSKLKNSLHVTGFGYDHGEKWSINMKLFEHFTDITQGVRRLGAASIDLCHLACGTVDGFWELDLHPWDTAAGIVIVKEAGGRITKMNGGKYSIHGDQILASNGLIHSKMLTRINSISSFFNN